MSHGPGARVLKHCPCWLVIYEGKERLHVPSPCEGKPHTVSRGSFNLRDLKIFLFFFCEKC